MVNPSMKRTRPYHRAVAALGAALTAAAFAPARAADTAQIVATVCAACHGEDGNPVVPMFPKLAGLQVEYLRKQLMDFKTGKRKNDVMAPAMAQVGEGDIPALADWYAAKKTAPGAVQDAKLAEAGKRLYDDGNVDSGVPACVGCHQEGAKGNPRYPRLAGQHAAYTMAQMALFKSGARNNDRAHSMRSVADRMTDDEMAAVAEYLAALAP